VYPRGGTCTVTVSYLIIGFASEKGIPKVVSDDEINPDEICLYFSAKRLSVKVFLAVFSAFYGVFVRRNRTKSACKGKRGF
jgi:hypothetical protein